MKQKNKVVMKLLLLLVMALSIYFIFTSIRQIKLLPVPGKIIVYIDGNTIEVDKEEERFRDLCRIMVHIIMQVLWKC